MKYRIDQTKLPVRLLALALLLGLVLWLKLGHHELWKDEWQAWLMARDMSWGELLGSLYYEGHPALWYVYLKVWSFLPMADVTLIQWSHYLLIGLAFAVFLLRFDMPLWLKILFLLGYYPLFEYGVVNRGYAWVMLFTFLLVDQIKKEKSSPLLLGRPVFFALPNRGIWCHHWRRFVFLFLAQTRVSRSFSVSYFFRWFGRNGAGGSDFCDQCISQSQSG